MHSLRNLSTFILLLSGILLFDCAATPNLSSNDDQIAVSTSADNVSQADVDRVKKEAKKALNNIPPILGIQYNKRIEINIVDSGICHAYGGIVSCPGWRVRNKTAAIVHEVTHIIAKHRDNRFFSEGLAVYFQERFGEDHGFPSFSGMPLNDLVKKYKDQLMPISHLSNNNEIFRQVGTEKRKIAYIEAGSFVDYLVEAYGEQKLKELHAIQALNYKSIYGKSVKELEVEWQQFVFE